MSGPEAHCTRTGDAPRYVLGELEGTQHESFARYLQRCEECVEEVGLLEAAAAAVPHLATPYIPPEDQEELVVQRTAVPTPTLAVAPASARAARIGAERNAEWQPPVQTGRPTLRTIQGGAGATARTRLPGAPAAGC